MMDGSKGKGRGPRRDRVAVGDVVAVTFTHRPDRTVTGLVVGVSGDGFELRDGERLTWSGAWVPNVVRCRFERLRGVRVIARAADVPGVLR